VRKILSYFPRLARPVLMALMLCAVLFAQDNDKLSKEDKKFWENKAKSYVKDPESLKSEVQSYKDSIKLWKESNKHLELSGSGGNATYWQEVDSQQQLITKLENELRQLIIQNSQMTQAKVAVKTVNDMGIKTGLVYRVMFKEADLQEAARTFDRYVVGSFRTVKEAEVFQKQMKLLGLKGNTGIVAYIDGLKVEMSKAEDYQKSIDMD